jgi:hypothetical protein
VQRQRGATRTRNGRQLRAGVNNGLFGVCLSAVSGFAARAAALKSAADHTAVGVAVCDHTDAQQWSADGAGRLRLPRQRPLRYRARAAAAVQQDREPEGRSVDADLRSAARYRPGERALQIWRSRAARLVAAALGRKHGRMLI